MESETCSWIKTSLDLEFLKGPLLTFTYPRLMVATYLPIFSTIRCLGHFVYHNEKHEKTTFPMSERKISINVKPIIRLNKNQPWKYRLGEEGLVTCLCWGRKRSVLDLVNYVSKHLTV